MKHGRQMPFVHTRDGTYQGECAYCQKKFDIGAPRWLPDQVVLNKLEQKGLYGENRQGKDRIPKRFICAACRNQVAQTRGETMADDNEPELGDLVPNNELDLVFRYTYANRSQGIDVVHVLFPQRLGEAIKKIDEYYSSSPQKVLIVTRFVLHEGDDIGVEFALRTKDRIKKGKKMMQGHATPWIGLHLKSSALRPFVQLNPSIAKSLFRHPHHKGDLGDYMTLGHPTELTAERTGEQRYTVRNFTHRLCPALAPVGGHGDAESQSQADATGELARQASQQWPIQSHAGPPEGDPQAHSEATKPSGDPFDALKSHVEGVNMNILTLQEQGWEVEAQVDEGGFIQMRVVRQIN